MSDAPWSGSHAAYPQQYQHFQHNPEHRQVAGHHVSPYVHPAHGGAAPAQAYHAAPPQAERVGHGQGSRSGGGSAFGKAVHGVGALLSVALIAGLAVWGYQLAVRDVNGVPVVRALEGPMRIQPEDPGGVAAAHQGLAVNSVAAEGHAEGPAEQVALAPAPVALAEDDAPARSGAATAEVSAVPEAERGDAPENDMVAAAAAFAPDAGPAADAGGLDEATAAALALAEAATEGAAPLSGEETELALTPEAEERLARATIPASVPGVARSLRPAPRPDDIVARAAASPVEIALASASAATGPVVREVDPADIPVGTRLVQLGAFESAEIARSEWSRISGRFSEFFDGKDRVIQKAQSGGKTFYRLRAMGFEDVADIRHFCATLAAGQADCIPVVTR